MSKSYQEMSPAERAAARIAQNRVIEANAAETISREKHRKVVKKALSSRKALKALCNQIAKEDPNGAVDLLRRIAPMVTFRTVRGVL